MLEFSIPKINIIPLTRVLHIRISYHFAKRSATNLCFLKRQLNILQIKTISCFYFMAFALIHFHVVKGCVIFLWPKIIIASFFHLIVLIFKVFNFHFGNNPQITILISLCAIFLAASVITNLFSSCLFPPSSLWFLFIWDLLPLALR